MACHFRNGSRWQTVSSWGWRPCRLRLKRVESSHHRLEAGDAQRTHGRHASLRRRPSDSRGPSRAWRRLEAHAIVSRDETDRRRLVFSDSDAASASADSARVLYLMPSRWSHCRFHGATYPAYAPLALRRVFGAWEGTGLSPHTGLNPAGLHAPHGANRMVTRSYVRGATSCAWCRPVIAR